MVKVACQAPVRTQEKSRLQIISFRRSRNISKRRSQPPSSRGEHRCSSLELPYSPSRWMPSSGYRRHLTVEVDGQVVYLAILIEHLIEFVIPAMLTSAKGLYRPHHARQVCSQVPRVGETWERLHKYPGGVEFRHSASS